MSDLIIDSSYYRRLVRWSDSDGVYVARVVELPDVTAHGASPEEALEQLDEAIEVAFDSMVAEGEMAPRPNVCRIAESSRTGEVFGEFPVMAVPAGMSSRPEELDRVQRALMWRTELDGVPHYLFGTCHLPDAAVHKLPTVVIDAIESSHVFSPEISLTDEGVEALVSMGRLPEGLQVEDFAGAGVAMLIEGVARAHGWDIEDVMTQHPGLVLDRLVGRIQEASTGLWALDVELTRLAERAGCLIRAVETPEEQAELVGVSLTEPMHGPQRSIFIKRLIEMIDGPLWEHPMRDLYLRGSVREFVQSGFMSIGEDMGGSRNVQMAKRMHALMQEHRQQCFFAVGLAHLLGSANVLEVLELLGYEFERVEGEPCA